MIEVSYIVACDNAFFSDDKKLSIINIFDRILAKKFPAVHSKLSIVVAIRGDISKQKPKFEMISPNGESVFSRDIDPQDYNSEKKHTQMVFTVVGMPLNESGWYDFKVSLGGKRINDEKKHGLEVVLS